MVHQCTVTWKPCGVRAILFTITPYEKIHDYRSTNVGHEPMYLQHS